MPDPMPAHAAAPWPGCGTATRYMLTLAAGAGNAFGLLALGAVFTSVVTANSALLGLRAGGAHLAAARTVALVLLGYLLGVAAGSLLAAGSSRLPALGIRGGLALEALLLWLVAGGWLYWHADPGAGARTGLLVLMAAAMGCQNGTVRVTAGGDVTTAYLTGLVTSAVAGLVTRGRVPVRATAVVAALIAGAAATGAACRWLPAAAPLLPAFLVTAALAATTARAPSRPGSDSGVTPHAGDRGPEVPNPSRTESTRHERIRGERHAAAGRERRRPHHGRRRPR